MVEDRAMSPQAREAVRIQLEGNFEVVEALAARWQAAAKELEADSKLEGMGWYGLSGADAEGAGAVAELERRAPGHPLLTQLADARRRVATALLRHTAAVGLELQGTDARELLNELRPRHPIDRVQVSMVGPKPRAFTRDVVSLAISLLMFVLIVFPWHADWEHVLWAVFILATSASSAWNLVRRPRTEAPGPYDLVVAGRSIRLPSQGGFEALTLVTWSGS